MAAEHIPAKNQNTKPLPFNIAKTKSIPNPIIKLTKIPKPLSLLFGYQRIPYHLNYIKK